MVFLIVCSFGFLCVQDRAVEHMMYDDINISDVRMLQRTEDRKQDDDVVTFNVERCEKGLSSFSFVFMARQEK